MDFTYPPEAEAFRTEFRAWLDTVSDAERSLSGGLSFDEPDKLIAHRAWNARLADAGYAAIAWPVEYGGRGAGVMEQVVWARGAAPRRCLRAAQRARHPQRRARDHAVRHQCR